MIPDGEHITYAYLHDHASVTALDARVLGKTPDDTDSQPWAKLTQLDATSDRNARFEHLVGFMLQIDCYASRTGLNGSPWAEAKLVGRTVRAALVEMPDATHDGAVVTSVRIVGDIRRPDTDFEPARERVILTTIVHMHGTA